MLEKPVKFVRKTLEQTSNNETETNKVEAAESDSVDERQKAKHAAKREIFEFVKMVAWFLLIFLALRAYVVEGFEVQGTSMLPNLKDRDRILVFKLPHRLSQFDIFSSIDAIRPGDIVVLNSKDDPQRRYVKRVVAEGPKGPSKSTVEAREAGPDDESPTRVVYIDTDGSLFVENKRVEEPYLEQKRRENAGNPDRKTALKPGESFVLGDNRRDSKDSRIFGPITDDEIIGKAVLRFWPLSSFGLLK